MNNASCLDYRPDIDGLRALSIIGVVLFHARLGFAGGYVGVDVFFVISGFLITRLILKEMDGGTFSLCTFWARRVRRIMPAFVAMIAAVLVLGYWLMLPADLVDLAKAAMAQVAMMANVNVWLDVEGGYFAGAAALRPLLHMWSLAVEEQFYVLFPLFLLLCRRLRRRVLVGALLLLMGASFVLSVYGAYRHPSAAFYLLPSRAWELLAGSILAVVGVGIPRSRTGFLEEAGAVVGLGSILVGMFGFDHQTRFPGWIAVVPVFGAVLIVMANVNRTTYVGRLLSLQPVVFIGLISYSLYVWHWPVFAFARYVADGPITPTIALTAMASAFLLAILSWHLVEEPIRRNRELWSLRRLVVGAVVSLMAITVLGGVGWSTRGCAWRLPLILRDDGSAVRERADMARVRKGDLPLIGDTSDERNVEFIVWGDSHAGMALPVFSRLGKEYGVKGLNAAFGGHPPIPGVQISWNDDLMEWNSLVLDQVAKRGVRYVFLVARWASYVEGAGEYDIVNGMDLKQTLLYENSPHERSQVGSMQLFERRLEELCRQLVSGGHHVVIFSQVPEQVYNPARRAFVSLRTGGIVDFPERGISRLAHQQRQRRVEECFLRLRQEYVHVLNCEEELFDDRGDSRVTSAESFMYVDNHHLTPNGSVCAFQKQLEPLFLAMNKLQETRHCSPAAPSSFSPSFVLSESADGQ